MLVLTKDATQLPVKYALGTFLISWKTHSWGIPNWLESLERMWMMFYLAQLICIFSARKYLIDNPKSLPLSFWWISSREVFLPSLVEGRKWEQRRDGVLFENLPDVTSLLPTSWVFCQRVLDLVFIWFLIFSRISTESTGSIRVPCFCSSQFYLTSLPPLPQNLAFA